MDAATGRVSARSVLTSLVAYFAVVMPVCATGHPGTRTSDGPDVRVWLSDQPVPKTEPFDIYGQGRHVELGPLKGKAGDLVYDIPAGVDVTAFKSVDLWCKRFSVSFGAAELRPV